MHSNSETRHTNPLDPLATPAPAPVRILLSEAASRHLSDTGHPCFAVVSFDRSDEHSGRWVIHLLPCSIAEANSAVRVARGISTERKASAKP
jgi:hypothetical protein